MDKENFERYYLSQVGVLIRDNKCLLLEYELSPGHWGLPGGRIEKEEERDAAFLRELREEIGFKKVKILDFIGYNLWYTKKHHNPMCGSFMLIESNEKEITLSHEHLQYKWVTEKELEKMKLFWPDMEIMIKKGFKQYRALKGKSAKGGSALGGK